MRAVGTVDDMGELTERIADTHGGRPRQIASFLQRALSNPGSTSAAHALRAAGDPPHSRSHEQGVPRNPSADGQFGRLIFRFADEGSG
jgi:hypothetical protein